MIGPRIREFLEALKCTKVGTSGSTWIKACCPLAPWTHAGGTDNRPSFYVAIDDIGHSGVKCHTCQFRGTLTNLLWKMVQLTSANLTPLFKFVSEHDSIEEEALEQKISKIPEEQTTKPIEFAGLPVSSTLFQLTLSKKTTVEEAEFSEDELNKFGPLDDESRSWLTKRGFLSETLEKWEIRWHPGARRIAIPVRDKNGKLVCVSGRSIDPKRHPKFMHSKGFKRDFYVYGEHLCQTHKVGYLVEGFFDAMMLWQHGYRNPLGFMGSYLSDFQVEKIVTLCDSVIIVPDGDEAGTKAAEQAYKVLAPRLRKTRIAEAISGKDPDELPVIHLRQELGDPQEAPLDDLKIA